MPQNIKMKITYNNQVYTTDNLNKLGTIAPFFKPGIQFIQDWAKGQDSFIFKSSGSTGLAKEIEICRDQILSSVLQTKNYLELKSTDKVLVCLGPEYVATKMMIARCLASNLDIILVEPCSNPLAVIDKRMVMDFASFVPLQMESILKSEHSGRIGAIRNILIGGAPTSNALNEKLRRFNNNIYHTYGMTETVSHIGLRKLSQQSKSEYFKCLDEIKLRTNSEGCLVINGGVTNHLDVITNDVVEMKNDREFRWLGRKDNLINSGGVKIIPEQLEKTIKALLDQMKISRDFFLYGIKDELLGQKLVLVLEGSKLDTSAEKTLCKNIGEKLIKYHIPKKVIYINKFIRTTSGKVKRSGTIELSNL